MSLFTKLFGKKKKKHHGSKTKPIVCDDCNPQDCECVIDDCESHAECDSKCIDDD